jgi:hypothetical protein
MTKQWEDRTPSLLGPLSDEEFKALMAPDHPPYDVSLVQLTRCPRCLQYLTRNGHADRYCRSCAAHLPEDL